MIKDIIQNVYSKRPLVHNITNYVAATDCANITLTIGASPIMADEPKEVGEVTQIADGLVLNCGTISESRLSAMLISGKTAKSREIPIVLDPVGVGISKFRTSAVHKIITEVKPGIIRLNASELKSICLNIKNMSGLDDTVELAKKLSLKTNAIIGVSGISDIVTDGKNTAVISGGHAMMKKITGSGCMLSSVIGAFAAANPNNLFYAVSVAFGLYASCGRNAYKENIGIATYKNNFFDEMTNPDLEGIEIEYR